MSSTSKLYPPADISKQTVLVTGASSGIGEACAWRFAEAGCKLVLTARRTDRLEKLAKELHDKYKVPVHSVSLDLMDFEKLQELPKRLPAEFREVDILLNNAGLALGTAPVQDNKEEHIISMVNTNITAVALLTKIFAAGMVKRERGHIVNISSIAAHWSYPGGSIYSATKHFIHGFTECARHDLVGTPIRVTAISPGAVETEFSKVRYGGDSSKASAVYDGIEPLVGADVADNVMYAVTRPSHVQIGEQWFCAPCISLCAAQSLISPLPVQAKSLCMLPCSPALRCGCTALEICCLPCQENPAAFSADVQVRRVFAVVQSIARVLKKD
eukprot:jgi/Astpho2/7611/e_gw1.00115.98.1_t